MNKPIVLVVVIVLALVVIGVTVHRMRGPVPITASSYDREAELAKPRQMKCAACGHTTQMTPNEAYKLGTGGARDLNKCPKCGKFAFGFVGTCSKHGEFLVWEFDKPCPKCAAGQ